MNVIYKGSNEKVIDCVEFINQLFEEDFFYDSISDIDHFTHTEYSKSEILEKIKNVNGITTVKLYKSLNPWTRSNAYVSPKHKNTLFLNTRKLWRDKGDIINTIMHECVHVIDFNDNNKIDFGHGDNYSRGKENSVPYRIGQLAKDLYLKSLESEMEIESIELDDSRIINE